jgi:hypothetical protein
MDPDPGKLVRPAAGIDLGIEKIGHRRVEKLDVDWRSLLVDEQDVLD